MAGDPQTSTEYVKHHLQNLTYGKFSSDGDICGYGELREAGTWGVAHCSAEAKDMGFMAVHLDSIGWSFALGLLFILIFGSAARKATSGVPGMFQNAIESVIAFVETSVKESFPGKDRYIAPISLTVFMWVLFMNTMDLVPIDLLPRLFYFMGVDYMKVVPTTDPNITFGMAINVLLLIIVYSIRAKGISGFIGDLTLHPLTTKWAIPFNFLLETVALLAKPFSLALRLYGNLFAGELIFIMIALMFTGGDVAMSLVGGVCQILWAVFHILVIVLQAYIFMMLTIIYLGMAQQDH